MDNYLPIETGQVCPRLPLLFNILLGVLANAMRKKYKQEIGLGGSSERKLLCADDIIINLGSKRTHRKMITTKKRIQLLDKGFIFKNQ